MLEKLIELKLIEDGVLDFRKLQYITYSNKNLSYRFTISKNKLTIELTNQLNQTVEEIELNQEFTKIIITDLPIYSVYYMNDYQHLNLDIVAVNHNDYIIHLNGRFGTTIVSYNSKNYYEISIKRYSSVSSIPSEEDKSNLHQFKYVPYKGFLYIFTSKHPHYNATLIPNKQGVGITTKTWADQSYVTAVKNCNSCSKTLCIRGLAPYEKSYSGYNVDMTVEFQKDFEYMFVDSHVNDAIYWKKGNRKFSIDTAKDHTLPPMERKISSIVVNTKKDFDAIEPYHDQNKNLTVASTSSLSIWKRSANSTDEKWRLASFKFFGDQ